MLHLKYPCGFLNTPVRASAAGSQLRKLGERCVSPLIVWGYCFLCLCLVQNSKTCLSWEFT